MDGALPLAVPARHAKVENEPVRASARPPDVSMADLHAVWASEVGGRAWVDRLVEGGHPRAVWGAVAGTDWAGVGSARRCALAGPGNACAAESAGAPP